MRFDFRHSLTILSAIAILSCTDASIVSPGSLTDISQFEPGDSSSDSGALIIASVPGSFVEPHPNVQIATIATPSGNLMQSALISGVLQQDLTLIAGVPYVLNGQVSVGEDGASAVTLTIEPGATIYAQGNNSGLVIARGHRIEAAGTDSDPIVFTSIAQLERSLGYATADSSTRGEWLGIAINGGSNANDNSGTLQYLRVEHAGIYLSETEQSSGIAFQDVGNGTTVDHIQIHNSGADGISVSGGAVNATYVVVTQARNDSIDWADGWQGSLQYVFVGQSAGDYAIRGRTLASNPQISNFTLIGSNDGGGAIFLEGGTQGRLVNGVVERFSGDAIHLADAETRGRVTNDTLILASILFDTSGEEVAGGTSTENEGARDAIVEDDVVFDYTELLLEEFVPEPTKPEDFSLYEVGSFGLDAASYVGAFSADETADENWTTGWIRTGSVFADMRMCPAETTFSGYIGDRLVCSISGIVEQDLTLVEGDQYVYSLNGQVFVGEDGGNSAVLTIEPGVTIIGDGANDGLVVTRGSQIEASGTSDQPIRFTSGQVLRGEIPASELAEATGHWLGLTINGDAPINNCIDDTSNGGDADCEANGEASSGRYGGNAPDDNSGTLQYLRVEYAGINFTEEDQSNGIAFQGVGRGTTVDHIQVHNNGDDGIEFFGGTVNAKYLIITGARDDSIDWTDGWQGNLQYVIIEQSADSDRGFEGDNRSVSDPDALPRSKPNISNFTILGHENQTRGALFREGTGGNIINGIIIDTDPGIDIDDQSNYLLLCGRAEEPASCPTPAREDSLSFASILLDTGQNIEDDYTGTDPDVPDVTIDLIKSAIANLGDFSGTNTHSLSGFSFFGRPGQGLVPGPSENTLMVSDPISLDFSFFDSTSFIGAVRDANDTWYRGWTIQSDGQLALIE